MNPEKLKKLQALAANVRIGGKGMPRRKKKVVHQTTATDDKKLQANLKKLGCNPIQGIEEVNLFKNDGSVIHFNNPRTQASLQSNVFAITGHSENKSLTELLPGILNHLGPEGVNHLKQIVMQNSLDANARDSDIPDEVLNFEKVEGKDDEKFEHIPPTEIVD